MKLKVRLNWGTKIFSGIRSVQYSVLATEREGSGTYSLVHQWREREREERLQ